MIELENKDIIRIIKDARIEGVEILAKEWKVKFVGCDNWPTWKDAKKKALEKC